MKKQRLVDWNVSIFHSLLEDIDAHRHNSCTKKQKHIRDKVVEIVLIPADYTSTYMEF